MSFSEMRCPFEERHVLLSISRLFVTIVYMKWHAVLLQRVFKFIYFLHNLKTRIYTKRHVVSRKDLPFGEKNILNISVKIEFQWEGWFLSHSFVIWLFLLSKFDGDSLSLIYIKIWLHFMIFIFGGITLDGLIHYISRVNHDVFLWLHLILIQLLRP